MSRVKRANGEWVDEGPAHQDEFAVHWGIGLAGPGTSQHAIDGERHTRCGMDPSEASRDSGCYEDVARRALEESPGE